MSAHKFHVVTLGRLAELRTAAAVATRCERLGAAGDLERRRSIRLPDFASFHLRCRDVPAILVGVTLHDCPFEIFARFDRKLHRPRSVYQPRLGDDRRACRRSIARRTAEVCTIGYTEIGLKLDPRYQHRRRSRTVAHQGSIVRRKPAMARRSSRSDCGSACLSSGIWQNADGHLVRRPLAEPSNENY